MSIAADFYATPGEPIRPKLKKLADHIVRMAGVQSGRGIRKHQYRNGTMIIADAQAAQFIGSFTVRISGTEATIGAGTVSDVTPTIKGEPIDGVGSDGAQNEQPTIDLQDGPNNAKRSWLCIEAKIDSDTKLLAETDDALIITHRNDLPVPRTKPNDGEPTTVVKAIAMVVWQNEKSISRVRQIVYFDQRIAVDGEEIRLIEAA